MFFQYPNKLPDELILNILDRLPLKDAIALLRVSKEMNALIKDDGIWKKYGAEKSEKETYFVNFMRRMNLLSKELKMLVLKKTQCSNALMLAEDISRIQEMSPEEKQKKLFTPEQVAKLQYQSLCHLLSGNGIMALREGLITPEQAVTFKDPHALYDLLRNKGIMALREGLITSEEVAKIQPKILSTFLTSDCILALRQKLITLEQAAKLRPLALYFLLNNGITALRGGLITPEQAAAFNDPNALIDLFSENGITALREKLITPEQAAKLDRFALCYLLKPNGIIALREKLITPEQAAAFKAPRALSELLNQDIQTLREKLITPEQAAKLSNEEISEHIRLEKKPKL